MLHHSSSSSSSFHAFFLNLKSALLAHAHTHTFPTIASVDLHSRSFLHLLAISAATAFMAMYLSWLWRRRPQVYLVDYACFRPPERWRISYGAFLEHSALNGMSEKTRDFQKKIIQHSGLSELTSLPPSYHFIPCRKGMAYSREESSTVFFSMLDDLFRRTSVAPSQIGILVVNCCLFYPSPSLSAMVVHRYRMRADIKSFNLSGMGCAASLLALDMARHLLSVNKETYALIVSSENMSGRDYLGSKRSMLIANCLFRTGGAAILLSNRSSDRRRAKYRLLHTVRANTAADDRSFFCITHGEDESGQVGVSLSKELMSVAADALTRNMTAMAPLVLPMSEMAKYAFNYMARNAFRAQWKPYTPDFKKAFHHFCIHAGGKAVIEELEKNLMLSKQMTEASTMTLYRFGNTSSTSVWYEMAYLEAMQRVKKGDRLWQVGLGSGFKCFSAVWESAWDGKCTASNPWRDEDGHLAAFYPAQGLPDCVEID